jgi:hypothetical protein
MMNILEEKQHPEQWKNWVEVTVQSIHAGFGGFFYGTIYLATKNSFATMFAHGLWDVLVGLNTEFFVEKPDNHESTLVFIITNLTTLVALAGVSLGFGIWYFKKKIKFNDIKPFYQVNLK